MKRPSLAAIAAATSLALGPDTFTAEPKVQLQELVERVKNKLQEGKKTEQDLDEELKGFDSLLAEHKGEKTDDIAQILLTKALFYAEALEKEEKAAELLRQVRAEFPGTAASKNAEEALSALAQQIEARKMQARLTKGALFPDFAEQDLDGRLLSLASYRGKVVLIDFWASWCDECVQELPELLKSFEKYHDKGFEIIGISLDTDQGKLISFIKERSVSWPQYFDGKGWQNKLASKYGIERIPSTYLLDKNGSIIGKDLDEKALNAALMDALLAN